MKVISLFDGISCARVALDKLGYKDVTYYSSETDKYAIQIANKNWPDTYQLGDVKRLADDLEQLPLKNIDLLIGGSPCQDLSIAGKRKGLEGERSGLFWEYVRILKAVKPKYFVLENVNSMPNEVRDIITETLGVKPIMINASLVSAQTRKRLFWTNIPGIVQPEDRDIMLKDILQKNVDDKYIVSDPETKSRISIKEDKSRCLSSSMWKGAQSNGMTCVRIGQIGNGGQGDRIYSTKGKSVNLSANGGGRGAKTGLYLDKSIVRKLTPIECERLQGLPDNYTDGQSDTQRYKALGNAFNVDVVAHILKNLDI